MRYKRQLMGEEEVKLDLTGSEAIEDNQGGILVMGSSSNGAQFLKINEDGELVTTISDHLLVTASVDVTGNVDQGLAGSHNEAWFVRISDGAQVLGTGSSAPLWITGSVETEAGGVTEITGTVALEGGEITVGNFPSVQEITGTVALEGGEITVGNFPTTQTITGTIDLLNPIVVGNFPVTQGVRIVDEPVEVFFDQPIIVTGSVALLEEPITITGTVALEGGEITVGNFPSVQEITGTVALEGGEVTVGNFPTTQSVIFGLAPTATRTSLTASEVSTQVLAENADRKGVMFYVSSSGEDVACYIGFGSGPITTQDASFILYSDDAYNLEQPFITAPIQSIFNLHTGSVRLFITEIT